MKRWLILIPLILLLAALALTVNLWLRPLLTFIGANTDLIQGLQAAAQLALWVSVALVAGLGYLRRDRAVSPPDASPVSDRPAQQRMDSGGVQVAGDSTVHGNQQVGDTIKRQINADAYFENLTFALPAAAASQFRQHTRLSPQALTDATKAYYEALIARHRNLSLKGMGVSDRVPLRLALLDLYVPLKARLELPPGDTWNREVERQAREASLAGRTVKTEDDSRVIRYSEPVSVLELVQQNDGLIILGDPGAGKTTFLKHLALRLALGQGAALGLGERLPVLVPLSAYANTLKDHRLPLDRFIVQYFEEIGADLPIGDLLAAALDSGTALVLLDGLDEVKETGMRSDVVERVTDFYTFRRKNGNKFVLTSRVVGYRAVQRTAEGLAECTLVDFDDADIAEFVGKWTQALERQAEGDTATAVADAERERQELLAAIGRNQSVRRLAANPLLLTILALMKRQGVTLPERRVELYNKYVETLLSSWNRARGLGRPPTRDLDVVQIMRILAPLALWMHEVNPGAGLVKREDLRRKLCSIYEARGSAHPEADANQLLDDVHEYAGLLLARGPEEYGFIHLTFEEYLAAVAVALAGQGDCRPIVNRLAAHVGEPAWREVALLTVGYVGIIQQLDRVAGDVVETLAAEQPGPRGEAVVLAGEAVLDAWPGGVPPESKQKVVDALVQTMQDAEAPGAVRRRAGLALGRLGWLPSDLDEFVPVPSSVFLYGHNREQKNIEYDYWIGKYPVTNAQYARFIADKGYDRKELWSDEGWRWRISQKRGKPARWSDWEWANPIFPVVTVTWYEAEAYANWLHAQRVAARVAGDNSRYHVRLPTEEEWERAARNVDGRDYPWQGAARFITTTANTREVEAEGTTSVCTYPTGRSVCGAWDMSGNVWEWTVSQYEKGKARRAVRGGSWYYARVYALCVSREWFGPAGRNGYIGFRVVVSLSDSGFWVSGR